VGEILSLNLARQALDERKLEFRVGAIASVASLILIILTIPPLESWLSNLLNQTWAGWTTGTLGRLATSAITTAVVSFLNVGIHYFDLKRFGVIRWQLK
jgi:hypothetical protein